MAEDEKLLDLLKDWALESIFPILKESGIGTDRLQYLTETDLEKIFPGLKYNTFASTVHISIGQSHIFDIEKLQPILEETPIGRDDLEY